MATKNKIQCSKILVQKPKPKWIDVLFKNFDFERIE